MNDKKNAFDLLRILLAICVLITHGLLIGGYRLQDPLAYFSKGQTDFAEFGVMGFFALSGFLIAASFERSNNILIYLSHRALRILPGFWVCLVFTAFLFAPAIFWLTGRSLHDFKFTGKDSSLDFLLSNFFLKVRQWNIKDVLDHSAFQQSLNGSLWSLYPELQCYCFTMLAGLGGLFGKNKSLLLIIAIIFFAFFAISFNFSASFGPTIFILSPALKLYATYLAGTLIYVFRDHLLLDKRGTLFLAAFTLLLLRFGGFRLASPLLIAMNLINIFQLFEIKIRYDVSYGVYIYGFVVQQVLFVLCGNTLHPLVFITLVLITSALIGILSFILIERPFMNLRRKTDRILNKSYVGTRKTAL